MTNSSSLASFAAYCFLVLSFTDCTSAAIVGMFDIKETLHKGIVPEEVIDFTEDIDYFINPFN